MGCVAQGGKLTPRHRSLAGVIDGQLPRETARARRERATARRAVAVPDPQVEARREGP
jgi:hypothetical protein